MKVLILCTGNSCRSQMAWGFLKSFDNNIQVCSAGTKPVEHVHPTAVKVMKELDIDLSQQVPTSVAEYLDDEWDYVITVCGGANESCPAFSGKVAHRIHIGFDDPASASGSVEEVEQEFRRIRDEIRKRFAEFYITEIKKLKLPDCACNM